MKGMCVHDKVGTCVTHGKGVKKVFEPTWLPSTSADGKKTMVYKKKRVLRCDVLAIKTEQRLKQTKISFNMKTTIKKTEGDKTPGGR